MVVLFFGGIMNKPINFGEWFIIGSIGVIIVVLELFF